MVGSEHLPVKLISRMSTSIHFRPSCLKVVTYQLGDLCFFYPSQRISILFYFNQIDQEMEIFPRYYVLKLWNFQRVRGIFWGPIFGKSRGGGVIC